METVEKGAYRYFGIHVHQLAQPEKQEYPGWPNRAWVHSGLPTERSIALDKPKVWSRHSIEKNKLPIEPLFTWKNSNIFGLRISTFPYFLSLPDQFVRSTHWPSGLLHTGFGWNHHRHRRKHHRLLLQTESLPHQAVSSHDSHQLDGELFTVSLCFFYFSMLCNLIINISK